jgi:hypothetical protein
MFVILGTSSTSIMSTAQSNKRNILKMMNVIFRAMNPIIQRMKMVMYIYIYEGT